MPTDTGPPDGTVPGQVVDQLLGRTARGDERAFERLYDAVAAPVHGLARRIVRDPAMAEEVTQEVMLELWRTAARYDPGRGGAMTWIMTIAHRRAVDRVRREQSAGEREARAARHDPVAGHDPVADRVEARLDHERVRRCLRTLTPLQHETVTLAYYGGHTYREVADLVGAPPTTVRTRMRDGIIRLRDCLGVER
ncbi:RNA polymerase sigma-70 factor (ECF subfamily) [Actinomadura pelletieri DSM 43383]|uniref:RNA polymerase sigma-70 factor (ECF subfamily) n=1 Tax=Actinomadura pelletieri DSM 43383 TaxID=1120940 RepID=A0A495QAW6_9ACTN|nr:ECF RNA polymerase sigma factor SigK [Actinomadura pelletieri]RKS68820.1 RNA polymerase sigma-70 factor (ECF subfamily) [Actinomadura pelletieri DSM 43383]